MWILDGVTVMIVFVLWYHLMSLLDDIRGSSYYREDASRHNRKERYAQVLFMYCGFFGWSLLVGFILHVLNFTFF